MENLNIDIASEYLVMAAELVHLKSKMLIHKEDEEDDTESEFGIQTEEDLRQKILEYDKIKELTTELEENHPFGRLFDMDVIGTDGEKLSRGVYRKCLICGCQAHECARSRKHTVAEMQAKIEEMLS